MSKDICSFLELDQFRSDIRAGKIKLKKKPRIGLKLDGHPGNHSQTLLMVARSYKLKDVSIRNVFKSAEDLAQFLQYLYENKSAKRINLDIFGNEVNLSCISILKHMIEKNKIAKLKLPAYLSSDFVNEILLSFIARDAQVECLEISNTILSNECFDNLEKLLLTRKVKDQLSLVGCGTPEASSIKRQWERLNMAGTRKNYKLQQQKVLRWNVGTVELPDLLKHPRAESLRHNLHESMVSLASTVDSGFGSLPSLLAEPTGSSLCLSTNTSEKMQVTKTLLDDDDEFQRVLYEFENTLSEMRKTEAEAIITGYDFERDLELQHVVTSPADATQSNVAITPSKIATDSEDSIRISESFSIDISPDGGTISFFDCLIDLPRGCFDKTTKMKGKLEISPNKCPKGYIPITPMLYLESNNPPQKAITVRMTSWCINDGSEAGKGVEVDVLHLPKNSGNWEVIATLPFQDETKFQFDTSDYSPFVVALRELFFGPQEFLIEGFLYSDRNDNFKFLFHLQHSLFEYVLGRRNYSNTSDEKLKSFNTLSAKVNDTIKAEISSENLNFANAGTDEFQVDENFTRKQKWWRFETRILNNISDEMLILRCGTFQNNIPVQRCECAYKAKKGKLPPIACEIVAKDHAVVNVHKSLGDGEALALIMIVLSIFVLVVGILLRQLFFF